MKIANKISVSFLTVGLILTGIAASFFYVTAKDSLEKSIVNNLSLAVHSRTNHIETYLEMLELSVKPLIKSTVLEHLLKVNGKEDAGSHEAIDAAVKRLKEANKANLAIDEYLLLDAAGHVVASDNRSVVGEDKSTDAYFLGAQKGTYIKDVYFYDTKKMPLMVVSEPLFDSQTNRFLGVIVARVVLDDLNKIVTEKNALGDSGEIYIVNKYGVMITPSRFKEDTVLKQRIDTRNLSRARPHKDKKHPLSEKKNKNIYLNYRGARVLGAYAYIPRMEWVVLAEMDASEAFQPMDKIRQVFIVILFIVPIAAWLFGLFIARLIAGPLNRLARGAEIIGGGNLDYVVDNYTKDELGQLSRAFDTMAAKLKRSTTSVENLNREIVEREKTTWALKQSQADYRDLFENSRDAIMILEPPSWKFTSGNRSTLEIFGIKNEKKFTSLVPWLLSPERQPDGRDSAEKAKEMIETAMRTGSNLFEWTHKGIDGKDFPANILLTKVEYGGKTVLQATVRDITEQKRIEANLKKQAQELSASFNEAVKSRSILSSMLDDNNQIREKLERTIEELKSSQNMLNQSEKLASLGRLVSEIAHEVNNPLMIISGNAQLSLMSEPLSEEVKNNLRIITEECQRAKGIIQRLLRFSKPSKGETKEVNINESIEKITGMVEYQFKLANVEIKRHYLKNPPLLKIDEQQMQEVFMNLMNNAKDAIPVGGSITIATSLEHEFLRIDFKDTGSGMPEEIKKKIFEPFFTTKEKGTGLGLPVCYGIVKSHNGEIYFESEVNKGTTATVLLPLGGGKT